ncbi:MAG: hypothetical protein H8D97_00740 [Proteobacteria bacterium]|nr:hypothetical protein [Pseudomonadota bacterium]
MALSQRDLGLIKKMINSAGSSDSSAPVEVKCNCDCKCNCITEAQVEVLIKGLDDKLNALYTEIQNIKSASAE